MSNRKLDDLLNSLKNKDKISILFVCLGNICRSPAAEGVMLDIVSRAGAAGRWLIDSAGTGDWHVGQLPDRRMRVHARNRGLELTHRCRQVRESDFSDFDIIVAMDANNELDLRGLAPTDMAADKIVRMTDFASAGSHYDHVPDPYYEGAEGFELVLDLLDDSCNNLFKILTPGR